MIHKEEQKEYFEKMGVKTIVADLEGDLQYAVKAADRIIFAAGSGGHTPPQKTIDVDQNGAISLIYIYRLLGRGVPSRSEEHTSELQSRGHLVCRLLLEKKKNIRIKHNN